MLQLHLSDNEFYYLQRCVLYQKFDGNQMIYRAYAKGYFF